MTLSTTNRSTNQKKFPRQTVNLALEWVAGEISTPQACEKFGGLPANSTVYRMGAALRQAYGEGRLQIVGIPA